MVAVIGIIILHAMSLGIHLVKDGEKRTDRYSLFNVLIAQAILFTLYYYGGLFKVFL